MADALDLVAWQRAVRAGDAASRRQARKEREAQAAKEAEQTRLAESAKVHAKALHALQAARAKELQDERRLQSTAARGAANGLDILNGFAHGERNRSQRQRAASTSENCAQALKLQTQATAAAAQRLVLQRQRLEHVEQSAREQRKGLAQAHELIQEMEIEDDGALVFAHRQRGGANKPG
jgi:hypothetical protein